MRQHRRICGVGYADVSRIRVLRTTGARRTAKARRNAESRFLISLRRTGQHTQHWQTHLCLHLPRWPPFRPS